jgi:uncharacterized protein
MSKRRSLKSMITRAGSFWAVALALVIAGAGIAQAQYYYGYGGRPAPPPPSQRGFFPFFAPYQGPSPGARSYPGDAAPDRAADYSRAPAPKKSDTVPERSVVVLGDAMADWLAYGLEDAFSETPEIGIIRKHRTVSGLIRYQPRGAPEDWVAAARDILANEKPSAILIMLGLNDRQAIREQVPNPNAKGAAKPDAPKDATKPEGQQAKPEGQQAKPEGESTETAQVPDDEQEEQPAVVAPERATRSAGGLHEFRTEKWIELYRKKIADMIAVAKGKGVPVLWVGLPAIRGQRSTADVLFLDGLYREEASKAGITYVDVWDGFVDERGAFLNSGPDVEGQTRRLRSQDGVYFTRPGARKLAHYTERELTRLFQNRLTPVALPSDAGTPDVAARPGVPAPRPLAGPIVPLTASSVNNDQLLGGAGSRPVFVDATTARILVKGEPLPAPAGRADDFAWPRRDVGTADTLPLTEAAAPPQTAPPAVLTSTSPTDSAQRPRQAGSGANPAAGQAKLPPRRADGAPRQQADGVPRPPAAVGPSAQAPPRQRGWFFW